MKIGYFFFFLCIQLVYFPREIWGVNNLPVADAGPDQVVYEGDTVWLDGTRSYDKESSSLSYRWTINAPDESQLSPEEYEKVPLSPEQTINYGADGWETDDIKAYEGIRVFLCFSESDNKYHTFKFIDEELKNILVYFNQGICTNFLAPSAGKYEYCIDDDKTGFLVVESILNDPNSPTPYFIAPDVNETGNLIFTLTVNDGIEDSDPDCINITIKEFNNSPPVANAGDDQVVFEGDTVFLNGTNSYDADGDSLRYHWYEPNGINLIGRNNSKAYFIAPLVLENKKYHFSLQVNDGIVDSDFDDLIITVMNKENDLPLVVDNSKYFPPVRGQQNLPDCGHFALIYYLKSSIWNKKFGRDPKLEKNQFNHNFVWNQNIAPSTQYSTPELAFLFMENQGCATVADFAINETTFDRKPTLEMRKKALQFRTKQLIKKNLVECFKNQQVFNERLQELKTNLNDGKSFVLDIPIFDHFYDITKSDSVYNCYPDLKQSEVNNGHFVTVVGYNDTIKTLNGRGVFIIRNSNTEKGRFYLDYHWLYLFDRGYTYYMLEEYFDFSPKIVLDIQIEGAISNQNLYKDAYMFVDTIINNDGVKKDFKSAQDYLQYKNFVQVYKVNGKRIPLRNTSILMPINNKDGNYELISDLTNLFSNKEFVNLEVIVFDPVSVEYVGKNNSILFFYERNSRLKISSGSINLLHNDEKYVGTVINLPDTTFMHKDFYSPIIGYQLNPVSYYTYVKTCTSLVKRKVIKFSKESSINKVPIADAGHNQEVNEATTVVLDASGSKDPDGDALNYHWTAPEGIELNSATVVQPEFVAPRVNVDTTFTFILVVNDGTVDSEPDHVTVTIKNVNKVPVADAGPNQEVEEGAIVVLDASGSSDPDGDALNYHWTAPEGIELNLATMVEPEFVAPKVTADTTFTFTLVVNDGTVDSEPSQVAITIKKGNKAPIANAGQNQEVEEGATVVLDASGSSDSDGDALNYNWTAPEGIELNSATIAQPEFVAPDVTADTTYTFTLIVNDGTVDSEPLQVNVTVKNVNKLPIADAGPNQEVNEGSTVTLDGTDSNDADGDALNYNWTAPEGIELNSATIAQPEFVAPEITADTTFAFILIVSDGTADSEPVQVNFTVKNVNKAPIADAGPNQEVNEGSTVILDGTGSNDADGDALNYNWTAPEGIELNSATIAQPEFTVPEVDNDSIITFSLVVDDGSVSSSPSVVSVTILNVITNLESLESVSEFKIYPNPTTGILNFEVKKINSDKIEITVSTLLGKEIFSRHFNYTGTYYINLSEQASGVYLLRVSGNDKAFVKKLIVK